jgi:hypothetical protein
MSLLFGIAIALKIVRARSELWMSSLLSALGENIIKKFFGRYLPKVRGRKWRRRWINILTKLDQR